MIERLLTPVDVAEILGIPVKSLYAWRHRGVGPQALKIGRHLRYRPSDVEAFLAGPDLPSGSDGRSQSEPLIPSTTR
jgi:predicted DNA-binding transcriptional regulator AlpA